MKSPEQLYQQSQEQIIPIIDFIPINSQSYIPESMRWRFKQQLDESRERQITTDVLIQSIPTKIDGLRIGSSKNDFDKKTTSIMQGVSINSISSNEYSLRIIKDNLKSYHSILNQKNRYHDESFQKPQSNYHINNLHICKERKRILESVDKILSNGVQQEERRNNKSNRMRRQKQQLLKEIVGKLETAAKYSKPISLLRQTKSHDRSMLQTLKTDQMDKNFIKKSKKWVEAKNSLKEAASISATKCPTNSHTIQQHQVISFPVSQWQQAIQAGSNTLPFSIQTGTFDNIPQRSSNFTSNKQFPSQRQEDIFSFNNLQEKNLHRHIKNVSIEVEEQNNGKIQTNQDSSNNQPVINCVLCKIIGKKCSFH